MTSDLVVVQLATIASREDSLVKTVRNQRMGEAEDANTNEANPNETIISITTF